MRKSLIGLLSLTIFVPATPSSLLQQAETARWQQHVANITITRDDWGIAHVKGKSDADAVFGMVYAQAEDDFNRVETNFINSQGRMAEAEGEAAIWRDLRMKLFIDPDSMKALYAKSPESLKKLMVAWADGLNFYLSKHPETKPRVLTKFEPWMALTFSEGSIGGDIERVNLDQLQAFYTGSGLRAGDDGAAPAQLDKAYEDSVFQAEYAPSGSNGFAVAPKITKNGRAILLINPHTSHYFRSELQMTSDEGLNAYGAATWGQFFIYQGFNENAGWMHTTSTADASDNFSYTVTERNGKFFYKYGSGERAFTEKSITIPYRTATGMANRTVTAYYAHTGPVVRAQNGKWISYQIMQEPVKALSQSFGRTKARNIADYKKTMELQANTSNNTLYADRDGNIAHFYVNFVPKRDVRFDYRQPVDGSDPASDWKGLHSFNEVPNAVNPNSGWVYNANDWPWMAAGAADSPKKDAFPAYIDAGSESARGRHAVMVLENKKDFDIEGLRAAAYDTYMPGFDRSIPALIKAYDAVPNGPIKEKVAEQIELLRKWDLRWSISSVPTSLAIYYTTALQQAGGRGGRGRGGAPSEISADQMLQALATACERLTAEFGKCNTPWGDINRFQRIRNEITPSFSDAEPSIPVGFPGAGMTGSLASFAARAYPNTKKWYGSSGNSFVAVVEFGKDSVRAIAVTAGGESGDAKSKHFNDQAERYATGALRPVYFYPNQLRGHTERMYKPGQ
jgi:acyl-homoserine-lactone acylase